MYASQASVGSQLPSQFTVNGSANNLSPAPPVPQVHPQLQELNRQLGNINANLDSIIMRLSGPRPMEIPQAPKAECTREPSTLEHVNLAHKQICEIQLQIQQIADSIG